MERTIMASWMMALGLLACGSSSTSAPPSGPAALTMAELTSDPAAYLGQEVELTGNFKVTAVGDDYLRIILVDAANDGAPSVDCFTKGLAFATLERGAEVKVRGTVEVNRGKTQLKSCVRSDVVELNQAAPAH